MLKPFVIKANFVREVTYSGYVVLITPLYSGGFEVILVEKFLHCRGSSGRIATKECKKGNSLLNNKFFIALIWLHKMLFIY